MYRVDLEDTIVAISTALGQGGIGIVRLSGKNALSIIDEMFVAKNKKRPSEFKSYTAHYGWVVDSRRSPVAGHQTKKKLRATGDQRPATGDNIVDEALVTVMRAPKSYTRQDIVEIHCHGGLVVLRTVLNLAVDLGARLADPGEFTKRAFLNGRIDLTQAEAVLDIIRAKTDAFLKVSLNQLKGDLTVTLESIREYLMGIYVELEAIVNFPEDEIKVSPRRQLLNRVRDGQERIQKLLASSEHGKILKEGIKVVICGRPNVGKSSLLNALLKQPRAIVTEIAGTTRDTIEETAQIRGIPFQLIDTAGILEPRDLIEREAVKRSRLHIENADLILFVIDIHEKFSAEDKAFIEKIKEKNVLVVLNKCDLVSKFDVKKIGTLLKRKKMVKVSALKKIAMDDLEKEIVKNVWKAKDVDTTGVVISNARHAYSLKECTMNLQEAEGALRKNMPLELVSEGVKAAVSHLDEITGRSVGADLLSRIFSEFCIGK